MDATERVHPAVEDLKDQLRKGEISRREFMRYATLLGVSTLAAGQLIGLLWPWLGNLPFGRLPGDIVIERDGFKLYLPLMTMLLLSALISLLFWLLRH